MERKEQNKMEDRPWPSVDYVQDRNRITSITELNENEVYIMIDFNINFTRDDKEMKVVTVIDKNLKEYKIWSVTAIDNRVSKTRLPQMMLYEGLKPTKRGKKMHMVKFANVTEKFQWIRDHCESRRAAVSNINEYGLYVKIKLLKVSKYEYISTYMFSASCFSYGGRNCPVC